MRRHSSSYYTARRPEALDLAEQLRQITEIGVALTRTRDLAELLDRILLEARRFTRAQAGTLYVREREQLRFTCVQNETLPEALLTAASGTGPLMAISRASIAGHVADTGQLLNIPEVRDIDPNAEYHFNQAYDLATGFTTHSMLCVPMSEPDGRVLGVIQLINARDNAGRIKPFPEELEGLVLSLSSQAAVAIENAQLTAAMKAAWAETIFRLARAAEFRDTDTGDHVRRMSAYSFEIALRLGLDPQFCESIRLAAPMHDIGKIGVPDAVLQKPGKLDPAEFEQMKLHSVHGAEILGGSDIPLLQLSEEIAHTHHEKWDGSGYPRGLNGESIPVAGRIVALADVFDALCSKRCYKAAMAPEAAAEIVRREAGRHFDPAVVKAFFAAWERILTVRAGFEEGPQGG